jgi:hypothetical protein
VVTLGRRKTAPLYAVLLATISVPQQDAVRQKQGGPQNNREPKKTLGSY